MTSDLQHNKAKGRVTSVVFLDITKAFDAVKHEVLYKKLDEASLPPRMLEVLKQYLVNRTVRAKLGDVLSAPRTLTRGVPQGGVLSPTLFNIVMANLPCQVNNDINMSIFADDIAIWSCSRTNAIRSLEHKMSNAVKVIDKYLVECGLSISLNKTVRMTIGQKRIHDVEVILRDNIIHSVKQYKFLGVIIDKALNWGPQIDDIVNRSKKVTNALKILCKE